MSPETLEKNKETAKEKAVRSWKRKKNPLSATSGHGGPGRHGIFTNGGHGTGHGTVSPLTTYITSGVKGQC